MYGKGKQLMIKTLILYTLLKKDYTMYSIRKHIETAYSMYIRPSFGGIKPALVSLEKNEFIKSGKLMSEGGKLSVYYSVTQKGREKLKNLLVEDMSNNPSQFFLSARLRLIMSDVLSFEERKRLFLIIKSKALKFKNSAQEFKNQENSFYHSIIADNTICEYSNLLTAIESLEKDNDRTRQ